MARWFTADTHFGHNNIIRYSGRPFADVDAMNASLVDRWNAVVAPEDEVWHLGDVVMGRREETLRYVGRLNGTIHLVAGNHDKCWGRSRQAARKPDWYREQVQVHLEAGFTSIQDEATIEIHGRPLLLSHFPYAGDHTEQDRYREARPTDQGHWLLHGHVHESWRQRGRQINVGGDAWDYEPVSEQALIEVMNYGPQDLDRLIPTWR